MKRLPSKHVSQMLPFEPNCIDENTHKFTRSTFLRKKKLLPFINFNISSYKKRYYRKTKRILKRQVHYKNPSLNSVVSTQLWRRKVCLLISKRSPDHYGYAIKSCISIKTDIQTFRRSETSIYFVWMLCKLQNPQSEMRIPRDLQ